MENKPEQTNRFKALLKNKAFIITFIVFLILLIVGYFVIKKQLLTPSDSNTEVKKFTPLFGTSKEKNLTYQGFLDWVSNGGSDGGDDLRNTVRNILNGGSTGSDTGGDSSGATNGSGSGGSGSGGGSGNESLNVGILDANSINLSGSGVTAGADGSNSVTISGSGVTAGADGSNSVTITNADGSSSVTITGPGVTIDPTKANTVKITGPGITVTNNGTNGVTLTGNGINTGRLIGTGTGTGTGGSTSGNNTGTIGSGLGVNNWGPNSYTKTQFQCSDGIDNDKDNFIDDRDPGCHSDLNPNNRNSFTPNANNEYDVGSGGDPSSGLYTKTKNQCSDFLDNDKDGSIDIQDPGCHSDYNALNPKSFTPNLNIEDKDNGQAFLGCITSKGGYTISGTFAGGVGTGTYEGGTTLGGSYTNAQTAGGTYTKGTTIGGTYIPSTTTSVSGTWVGKPIAPPLAPGDSSGTWFGNWLNGIGNGTWATTMVGSGSVAQNNNGTWNGVGGGGSTTGGGTTGILTGGTTGTTTGTTTGGTTGGTGLLTGGTTGGGTTGVITTGGTGTTTGLTTGGTTGLVTGTGGTTGSGTGALSQGTWVGNDKVRTFVGTTGSGTWTTPPITTKDSYKGGITTGGIFTGDANTTYTSGKFTPNAKTYYTDGRYINDTMTGGTVVNATYISPTGKKYSGGTVTGGKYTGGVVLGGNYEGGTPVGGTYVGGNPSGGIYTGGIATGGTYLNNKFYTNGIVTGGIYSSGTITQGRYLGGTITKGTYTGPLPIGGTYSGGTYVGPGCIAPVKPQCVDGIDNDKDGLVDKDDASCHSDFDSANDFSYKEYIDSEDRIKDKPNPKPIITKTYQCGDGIDNDKDTFKDIDDAGCHTDLTLDPTTFDPKIGDESRDSTTDTSGLSYQCSDGVDNDKDKLVDEKDPGCHIDFDATNPSTYVTTIREEVRDYVDPEPKDTDPSDPSICEEKIVLNAEDRAKMDQLLREFYRLAPTLATTEDVAIEKQNKARYTSSINTNERLTSQCYDEVTDPKNQPSASKSGGKKFMLERVLGSPFDAQMAPKLTLPESKSFLPSYQGSPYEKTISEPSDDLKNVFFLNMAPDAYGTNKYGDSDYDIRMNGALFATDVNTAVYPIAMRIMQGLHDAGILEYYFPDDAANKDLETVKKILADEIDQYIAHVQLTRSSFSKDMTGFSNWGSLNNSKYPTSSKIGTIIDEYLHSDDKLGSKQSVATRKALSVPWIFDEQGDPNAKPWSPQYSSNTPWIPQLTGITNTNTPWKSYPPAEPEYRFFSAGAISEYFRYDSKVINPFEEFEKLFNVW